MYCAPEEDLISASVAPSRQPAPAQQPLVARQRPEPASLPRAAPRRPADHIELRRLPSRRSDHLHDSRPSPAHRARRSRPDGASRDDRQRRHRRHRRAPGRSRIRERRLPRPRRGWAQRAGRTALRRIERRLLVPGPRTQRMRIHVVGTGFRRRRSRAACRRVQLRFTPARRTSRARSRGLALSSRHAARRGCVQRPRR